MMDEVFKKYKNLNLVMPIEQEQKLINEYIYNTNKLEGNKLTLAQTTSILEKGFITGKNISLKDILEHKGMEKALYRMFEAIRKKEPLSLELMKELNWLTIGSYFESNNAYIGFKEKGQKTGNFKQVENIIRINTGKLTPLSNVKNVENNMKMLLMRIKNNESSVIDKCSFLAQEIWLHQPFIDGNKRIGRLLVNFMTMKEKYPFFIFKSNKNNYNDCLIRQYIEKKPDLLKKYISKELKKTMKKIIDKSKESLNDSFLNRRFSI